MTPELTYRKGLLYLEDVSVERVLKSTGSPVYLYSAAAVGERYRRLAAAFKSRKPLICYALKANSNRAVCRILARAGAGADVVSGGELYRALRAGFKPGHIVFSGVGKTREEMNFALRRGVRALNVESAEELEALSQEAKKCRVVAPVVVRVNPDIDAGTHAHITTGTAANKFGVEAARAFYLYRRAAVDPWLTPIGMQCHIGSQVLKVAPFRRSLAALLRLVARLESVDIRLRSIDIGGGMGIRYGTENPFTPRELAAAILPALRAYPNLKLLLEPGRYLVGEAGMLVTRVLYRKSAGRKKFIIVDAAMTDLLRPALYGARHEIVPVRSAGGPKIHVDIVGPVCETADTFRKGLEIAEPAQGDALALLQAGAYGFSMSSQYNSRPRIPEVLVAGNRFRVVRSRETYADLVRHER